MIALLGRAAGILFLLWLTGCGGAPRAACYAQNDAEYLEVVAACEEAGYGSECPYLHEADVRLAMADARCP